MGISSLTTIFLKPFQDRNSDSISICVSLNKSFDISAAQCERAVIRQRHAIVHSNDDFHLVNFQATNVPDEAVILLCVLPLVLYLVFSWGRVNLRRNMTLNTTHNDQKELSVELKKQSSETTVEPAQ